MSKMKRKIKIIVLALLFTGIGLFGISAAIYVYDPAIIYRGIRTVAMNTLPMQPYDTKYGIHPYLLAKIEKVQKEARAKGIDLRVTEGYRDLETQQKYYEMGKTKKGPIITKAPPGMSYHNYGLAVDVCEYVDGKPNWHSEHWAEIGALGKKHGLVWGGDWKSFVDRPHLQLAKHDIILEVIF
jgi:peptidoglycan L-alanyl-D-glutamate endopeptidase CwlK